MVPDAEKRLNVDQGRQRQFVIRADASLQIGTGHVMRCLTLACTLRDTGHKVLFISRLLEGNFCDYIEGQGFPVARLPRPSDAESTPDWLGLPWETDARQTEDALNGLTHPIAWLVVDHYCLDARWEKALRPKVEHILSIDDLADRPHDCDVLLDQNLGRNAEDYAALVPKQAQVIAGPRYAMLRREFAEWRERSLARPRWPLRRILISMGGVDKDNATSAVLDVLEKSPRTAGAEIEIIMGQHSPWLEEVKHRAAQMRRATVYINAGNMAERMANSDLAIGAAGASSWERCCLGLPTLTAILADNQRPGAVAMDASGIQLTIGTQDQIASKLAEKLDALDQQIMDHMSQNSRALVDGLGVQRVMSAVHGYPARKSLALRRATEDDALILFQWANDEVVRKNSLNTQPIEWDTHISWLKRKLFDPNSCLIFIGETTPQGPFGQVRFDKDLDGFWIIDYSIESAFRNLGLGRELLSFALEKLSHEFPNDYAIGYVKPDNTSSKRIFESLNFKNYGVINKLIVYKRLLTE